jgi:hypothetical protein
VHVLFLQCIKPGSIWKTTVFVRQVRKAADCVALEVNITDDPKSEEVNNTVSPVFSCNMALGSTQSLTEMSTSNLPRGKGWLACNTDNFTFICLLTV